MPSADDKVENLLEQISNLHQCSGYNREKSLAKIRQCKEKVVSLQSTIQTLQYEAVHNIAKLYERWELKVEGIEWHHVKQLLNTEESIQAKLVKATELLNEMILSKKTDIAKDAETLENNWKQQDSLQWERWQGVIDNLKAKMFQMQEKHDNTMKDILIFFEWKEMGR